jgi:hypothetical protein
MVGFIPSDWVYSDALTVFAFDNYGDFAVLQSSLHDSWVDATASTMRTDVRYVESRCFGAFPLPYGVNKTTLERCGERFYLARQSVMHERHEGLTKSYNRFHNPDDRSCDIQRLRELHVEMDMAVATAYSWSDLDLGHGFHETKQGIRFTICESARREVLRRLLKLNHERYADEIAQGLHDRKGKAKPATSARARKSKASSGTAPLNFGDDEDDPEPAEDTDEEPRPTRPGTSTTTARADHRVEASPPSEPPARPTPIDQIETDDIMAAFRQAARGKGWLDRDELLKQVSLVLGYQRLGPKIDEALRGHLRAAIRRRIIETDGPNLVRTGTASMADYDLEEVRDSFRSVMRKGTHYEREVVISSLARYLGFVRLTDPIRRAIKSAITSAIRNGVLCSSSNTLTRN